MKTFTFVENECNKNFSMKIVTLINDWKSDALYSSMFISELISTNPNLNIINLISNVESYDFLEAAFILKNSYKKFPVDTIHLNFITEPNLDDYVVVKHHNQFFISPDNGFLSIVFDEKPSEIYKIPNDGASFFELKVYPKIVKVIEQNKLSEILPTQATYKEVSLPNPVIKPDALIGHIIYIDVYGNVITNFSKKFIEKNTNGKKFKVMIGSTKNCITKIHESYSDVQSGDLFYLYNQLGYLEIGMRDANLSKLFSIKKDTQIRIEFIEDSKQLSIF